MQFCTIQEAWGNDTFISDNYYQQNQKKLAQNFKKNRIENFKPLVSDLSLVSKENKSLDEKDLLIQKVLNCPYCLNKIKKKL